MTTIQALNDLTKRLELIANADMAKIALEIEHHIGYLIERHPGIDPNLVRISFMTNLTMVLVEHQKAILDSCKK